jgi:ribosomal protein S18 acetylase RimI-like enzyme
LLREGQVRVLFVLEEARGNHVGSLMNKAKEIGYKSLSLRTTNNQIEARELYKKIGFNLVTMNPNTSFAKGLYDEEWKMEIKP